MFAAAAATWYSSTSFIKAATLVGESTARRAQPPQFGPFRPVGQRADRIVVGHEDADRLALDRRIQDDPDGLAGRLGQVGVLDHLAVHEHVDGLGLHRAVIVQARDLDGPDLHGNHQADVHAPALEGPAEDGAVCRGGVSVLLGGQSLLNGEPLPLAVAPRSSRATLYNPDASGPSAAGAAQAGAAIRIAARDAHEAFRR